MPGVNVAQAKAYLEALGDTPTADEARAVTGDFDPADLAAAIWEALKAVDGDGGGGSLPGFEYVRTEFAFDTTDLAVQAFPITGVDLMTNTVTIAGDHTALFPAGRRAVISGSTGNDYDGYLVESVSFGGGSTSVVFDDAGALPQDATVDGNLVNNGTAGIVVATLGEGDALLNPGSSSIPFLVIFFPEAFDGDAPNVNLYPSNASLQGYYPMLGANADATQADDTNNFEGLWRDQLVQTYVNYNAMYPTSGTGEIVLQLFDNASHGAPGSTQGQGVIWVPVMRA